MPIDKQSSKGLSGKIKHWRELVKASRGPCIPSVTATTSGGALGQR